MSKRYYKVSPSFWLQDWDDTERLAAAYLLTSPHRNTEGIYRLPLDYAAVDMGWTVKRFDKALNELVAKGFAEYDPNASVVLLVNALKWQTPQNPNQITAAMKGLRQLPPTPLLNRFFHLARLFAERLAVEMAKEFGFGLNDPPAPTSTLLSSTSVGGKQA